MNAYRHRILNLLDRLLLGRRPEPADDPTWWTWLQRIYAQARDPERPPEVIRVPPRVFRRLFDLTSLVSWYDVHPEDAKKRAVPFYYQLGEDAGLYFAGERGPIQVLPAEEARR